MRCLGCTVAQLYSYITVAVEVRAMSSSLSRIGLSLEMAAILECRLENQPDCCQPGIVVNHATMDCCQPTQKHAALHCAQCQRRWRGVVAYRGGGAQWWRAGSEMEDWRYGVEEEELSMIPTMIHDP